METKILLIDDEARILQTFARTLRLAGYAVTTAEGGQEGLALYQQEQPDIVLLDLRMPGMDGLEVLQAMRERDPEANVILCTAHGDKDAVIDALRAGASDFLPKPVDQVTLESALRRAEERIHLKRELRASQEALRRHNERLEEEVKARTAELEREIEERKRTEAALRESEARERARAADLKTIMDAVPAVIWIARDPEGHEINGNPAAYRMLRMEEGANTSLTPADGKAPPHFRLFHDGVETPADELPMQLACKHGVKTRNHEGEVVFEDGTRRTIFGSTVPLRDEDGEIQGAVAAYVDITERKRMEEALSFQAMLLDQSEDMVTATDLDGNVIYVNDAEVRRLNYSREELVGRPVTVFGEDPAQGATQQQIIESTLKDGEWRGEVVNYTADGEEVVLDSRTRLLRDRDGNPTSMVGISTDVTERKRTEEALRESEEQLRLIVEGTQAMLVNVDQRGRITYVNDAATRMLGHPSEDLTGELYLRFVHPEDRARVNSVYREQLETGTPSSSLEFRIIADGGDVRWVNFVAHPIEDGQAGIALDITERKQVEEALRESQERLLTVLDSIDADIYVADVETYEVLFMNQHMRASFGEDLVGETCWEVFRDGTGPCPHCTNDQLLDSERNPTGVITWEGHNPITGKWYINYDRAIKWVDGRFVRLQVATDITARKRAEQALRENQKRFDLFMQHVPAAIFIKDREGRFVYVNDQFAESIRCEPEDLIGRSSEGFIPPDLLDQYERENQRVLQGERLVSETSVPRPEGTQHWITYKFPIYRDGQSPLIGSASMDITERKQMEAALRKSEERLRQYANQLEQMVDRKVRQLEQERAKAIQLDKLAALGEMATGLAHELNQPLAAIQLEANYLVRMGIRAREEHEGDLNRVLSPAEVIEIGEDLWRDLERCQRLIDHLRRFGRISQEPPAPICLNDPIEECFVLVGARLRNHDVTVRLDLAEDLPPILAHRYRLEQVFLNLISNAEYAMAQRAAEQPDLEKVLTITTKAVGDEVIAQVRDNGTGIPEDVQDRVFDPFFTTKPQGEGTGLGLSISYRIVADYVGEITCQSVEGQGTTFTVRLPAIEAEESA